MRYRRADCRPNTYQSEATRSGADYNWENTFQSEHNAPLISHIEMESTARGFVGRTLERRLGPLWVTPYDEAPVEGLSLELAIPPLTGWIVQR